MNTKLVSRIFVDFHDLAHWWARCRSLAQDEGEVQELGTGEIEINFWSGLGGPDGQSMTDLVTRFVEENPEVTDQLSDPGLGHLLRQALGCDSGRQRRTRS